MPRSKQPTPAKPKKAVSPARARAALVNTFMKVTESGDLASLRALLGEQTYDRELLESALTSAALAGHLDAVKLMMQEGEKLAPRYDLALAYACTGGHRPIVELLLHAGADLHFRHDGPLSEAAGNGHLALAEFLLSQGATPTDPDCQALSDAAFRGHLDCMKLLLGAGAPVNDTRHTALFGAAVNGHLEAVRLLLAHGATPDLRQGQALRNAAQGGHLEIVQLLVQAGVDVNARDDSGQDALRIAVHFAHVALVEWLLTQGVSPDGEEGKTLLEAAGAYSGARADAILTLLLTHGATAHRHGDAALRAARTSPGLTALLLAHGANPSALDAEEKYFLLLRACLEGDATAARRLMDAGVDPNWRPGRTDFVLQRMLSEERGDYPMSRLLFEHGARLDPPQAENNLLESVRHLRRQRQLPEDLDAFLSSVGRG